jgi:AcrR family transcriptional regulator
VSATTRARARRGEGAQLRELILTAASELLSETGREEALSLRAVAHRVGVTAPALYLHFPDKESIVEAVSSAAFDELDAVLASAGANAADPLERLQAQGCAYVAFARARPEHYRLMFMRRPPTVTQQPTDAELSAVAGFRHVIDTVAHCQAVGLIDRTETPTAIASALWAAVHGVAALLIAKPHFPWGSPDALVTRVTRMCARGLATR